MAGEAYEEQIVLTTREASAVLGVSESRVRQFVREGRLAPAIRLPRGVLLWRADVVRLASVPGRAGRPRRAAAACRTTRSA